MKQIICKCISTSKLPNGKGIVAFVVPGTEPEKPNGVINIQYQDATEINQFEHLKEYTISFELKE